jgi:hypothetical protein
MMRIYRVLGLCIFAAVTGVGSTSRAEDDPLSDTARELFVKGVKAYEQGKWDQCRAALLAAYAIKRHAQIAGNLADCELKLGKHRDAAEHAWFFLHALRPDAPAERRAGAQAQLKEAQQKVVTLRITIDVAGAEVIVDGQSVGKAPLEAPVFVEPGRHTIEALRAEGAARATIEAGRGESRDVALVLTKTQGLDGSGGGVSKPIVIGGATVSGVALLTGAVLLGVSAAKGSTASSLREKVQKTGGCVDASAGDCAELDSAARSKAALGNAGFWTLVGGGAVGVATLVYGVVQGSKAPQPKSGWRVLPTVTGDGGGVFVTGRF